MSNIQVEISTIEGRRIAIIGVGRALYERGYPIGMIAHKLQTDGVEVSWLHVADELQKNGWAKDTILSRLKEEASDSAIGVDIDAIATFLEATYEDQRDMIFSYLYTSRETASEWFRTANLAP